MVIESRQGAVGCKPESVVATMVTGVGFAVLASVGMVVASRTISALARPEVAAPAVSVELAVALVGALLLGVAATVGAALALLVFDRRLRRPRLVQALSAAGGAVLGAMVVYAALGGNGVVNFVAILGLVAVSAFALMWVRAPAHTRRT